VCLRCRAFACLIRPPLIRPLLVLRQGRLAYLSTGEPRLPLVFTSRLPATSPLSLLIVADIPLELNC
jgi:hypothetical protein